MPDKIQRARQFVQHVFQEIASASDLSRETILIRDGHYCGHRFVGGDVLAVWFCEEDEVKFYDRDRKLLRVESMAQPPLRRAA